MTEEVNPIQGEVVLTPHLEEIVVPVEEPRVEEVVVVEPVLEVIPEPVAKSKNEEQASQEAVAHGTSEKVVHTSALVFRSNSHNSASVALVQERLVELGFVDASADKSGWLSEGTMNSLAEFAKMDVEMCNPQDASIIEALFAGTQVTVLDCK